MLFIKASLAVGPSSPSWQMTTDTIHPIVTVLIFWNYFLEKCLPLLTPRLSLTRRQLWVRDPAQLFHSFIYLWRSCAGLDHSHYHAGVSTFLLGSTNRLVTKFSCYSRKLFSPVFWNSNPLSQSYRISDGALAWTGRLQCGLPFFSSNPLFKEF